MKVKVKLKEVLDKIYEKNLNGSNFNSLIIDADPVEEEKKEGEHKEQNPEVMLLSETTQLKRLSNFCTWMGGHPSIVGEFFNQEFDNIYRLIREMKG